MLALIIMLILGLGFAYFATLNTNMVGIRFDQSFPIDVPLYVVVLGSFLVGILIGGIMSFVKSISSRFKLYGKDSAIKDAQRTISEMTKRVHKLELENASLKGEDGTSAVDDDAL